jgi:hypothetical protein
VVLSLTQSRVLWLRLLSLSGSAVFTTYGFLIESWPLVITNLVIMAINSTSCGGSDRAGGVLASRGLA